MKILFYSVFIGLCLSIKTIAQQSQVLPWANTDQANPSSAYRPEPILFVHGINSNDKGWESALAALKDEMAKYQRPVSPPPITGLNATQYPFLHTFNYGNYVNLGSHNAQSFDHIEWNAWTADRNSSNFVNIFNGQPQTHPTDDRITLDERINGRPGSTIVGIRDAYKVTINSVEEKPNIVLVAHSMGGLLAHYYLCKCAETDTDSGVRRLVTLGSPHLSKPWKTALCAFPNLGKPVRRTLQSSDQFS